MPPDTAPNLPAGAGPVGPPDPDGTPVLPDRSPADSDVAWGDQPEPDDERLILDRPPHWDSA